MSAQCRACAPSGYWPRSRTFTFGGLTLTVGEWNERLGLSRYGVQMRLKAGWPLDRALTTRSPLEAA
jgi:hypothetical protein